MNKLLLTLLVFANVCTLAAQDDAWFYLRANDTLINPTFEKTENGLRYTGEDRALAGILSNHSISIFKKTYKNQILTPEFLISFKIIFLYSLLLRIITSNCNKKFS